MKVNETKPANAVERVVPGQTTTSDAAAPKDRVSVEAVREVETAVAVARRSAGGARAARLERLETAVRSGTFRPDPSRVAEQILADAEIDAKLQAILRH